MKGENRMFNQSWKKSPRIDLRLKVFFDGQSIGIVAGD